MPTPVDLVTDLPADFEVFGQAVDSSLADLKGGTSGQVLSKNSNTDMDFVWVTSDDANAIQNTIVDAKGDLIAASASDVPARLAVGNNGETLVADSSTSTGLRYNPQNALANPVINGGMDIWQRGTTSTIANSSYNYFSPDRWQTFRGSTGGTISRQVTGDTTNLPNVQYCMRVQRDSGTSSTSFIQSVNNFESINSIPYAGKTVTYSFYARAGANYSATSNALVGFLVTGTGTDQNVNFGFTGGSNAILVNATLTTTWQRFTGTATIPSATTQIGVGFSFTPTGTAGANDYYEVTGVQVDLGTYTSSTAPTFRRSGGTIQGELAACQRYFEVMGAGSSGRIVNTTTVEHYIRFTEKRVAPSFALTTTAPQVYDPASGTKTASGSTVALTLGSKVNGTTVQTSGYSSLTAGNWAIFNDNYLQVSAEL
jgi:hypothetical protein